MVGKQEVLVFAGEAEFEVPEGSAGSVKSPDAHQEQVDVGGNQAGDVLWVLECLQKTTHKNQYKTFKIVLVSSFSVSEVF